MRTTLILSTWLLLTVCTDRKGEFDPIAVSGKNDQRSTKRQIAKDDLIGTWGIYATADGKFVTLCNMCPTITFQENGKAMVNYSGRFLGNEIKWKREKQLLAIENITVKNGNGEFEDGEYSLSFGDNGALEVSQIGTTISFTLRRHGSQ